MEKLAKISKHGHSLISAIYSVELTFHARHFFGCPHCSLSLRLFGIKANQGQVSDLYREITCALCLMKSLHLSAHFLFREIPSRFFLNVQNSALWTESDALLLLVSQPHLQWSSKLSICWQPDRLLGFKTLGSWSCVWYCSLFSKFLTWNRKCTTHITGGKHELESRILEFRILLCHLHLST